MLSFILERRDIPWNMCTSLKRRSVRKNQNKGKETKPMREGEQRESRLIFSEFTLLSRFSFGAM